MFGFLLILFCFSGGSLYADSGKFSLNIDFDQDGTKDKIKINMWIDGGVSYADHLELNGRKAHNFKKNYKYLEISSMKVVDIDVSDPAKQILVSGWELNDPVYLLFGILENKVWLAHKFDLNPQIKGKLPIQTDKEYGFFTIQTKYKKDKRKYYKLIRATQSAPYKVNLKGEGILVKKNFNLYLDKNLTKIAFKVRKNKLLKVLYFYPHKNKCKIIAENYGESITPTECDVFEVQNPKGQKGFTSYEKIRKNTLLPAWN